MTALTSPITALSIALHLLVGVIVAYLFRAQGWEGLVAAGGWLLPLVLAAPAATAVVALAVRRQTSPKPAPASKRTGSARRQRPARRPRARGAGAAPRSIASRPLTRLASGR